MLHKEIFDLIKVLSPSEMVDIRKIMSIPDVRKKEENLSVKLVSFLDRKNVLPSEEEVIYHIYGESSVTKRESFKKLVYRTKKKVFDSLSSSLAMDNFHGIEEIDIIRIQLHKKAALLHYLRFKLAENTFIEQLQDEIIDIASDYEIYGILMEHLSVKKAKIALFNGEKALKEVNNKLELAVRSHLAIDQASELDHLLKGKASNLAFIKKGKFDEEVYNKINYLENEYKATGSSFLHYAILSLKLLFFQLKDDFENVKKIVTELLDLVQNNKVVKRKARIGMLLNEMVIADTNLGNYDSAVPLIIESQKYFDPLGINAYVSLEIKFKVLFYSGRFSEAKKDLDELIQHGSKHFNEFKHATYNLYKAYLYIINQDYKPALKLLALREEISRDKVGYDFWIRVLSICLYFRTGNEDAASMGVISLKKQITRISKFNTFRNRDLIVYRVLYQLNKNGFKDLERKDIKMELNKLNEPGNKWEPFSAEMIPFEQLLNQLIKKSQ